MIDLLHEYKFLFVLSHEDMKGLDLKFYQHQINLATDAKSVQQRCHRMNPNYAARVKEEIDKLLKVGFIWPVKQTTWSSPIVIIPKKNGKIRVCVDSRKLNTVTIINAFPLPFTDNVLDVVAMHEMYSFLEGLRGYNQIRMHLNDPEKMTSVMEWGVFLVIVMTLRLKTVPSTF